jgi:hypothetical protein
MHEGKKRENRKEKEKDSSNSLMSFLVRAQILLDQGSNLMTSFNLSYILRCPIPKYMNTWGLRFEYMNFSGTQINRYPYHFKIMLYKFKIRMEKSVN